LALVSATASHSAASRRLASGAGGNSAVSMKSAVLGALALSTVAEGTNVTRYVGYFVDAQSGSTGIGFGVFAYLTLVHVALACLAKHHFDEWRRSRKRSSDLSFITTTVEELKVECRKHHLSPTGRKAALLERLLPRHGGATKDELQELAALMIKCEQKGMKVYLKDVLNSNEALRLLVIWRQRAAE